MSVQPADVQKAADVQNPGVPDPELVTAADFGPILAERLAGPEARLLYLTRVPDLPAAPRDADGAGFVLAFYDGPEGTAALGAPARSPSRPSMTGVAAALVEEWRLERDGLVWSEAAPEPAVLGRGVFTFPLGPVHGDVTESVRWRLEVMGDEVLALRLRFGYKSRRFEEQLGLVGPVRGIALAERVTGTSPAAHAMAFASAWEAALHLEVPAAAVYWRAVVAELERLHSHLGDLASLANSTGLPAAAAELFVLKEQVLRLCLRLSGHRYQRGVIVVGGIRGDVAPISNLSPGLRDIRERFMRNIAQLDRSTSFLDRLHGAGRVPLDVAAALRPVGPTGRACGWDYDVRHDRPYGLYAETGAPARALVDKGDSWGRYRVRVLEVLASVGWLLDRLSEGAPGGSVANAAQVQLRTDRPPAAGIQMARVEAPRGELIYFVWSGRTGQQPWVRVRTASAVNWAVVAPAVGEGNVLQDVPIIDASFSLSVAAFDR